MTLDETNQQPIYWPKFTFPPLNLLNIYPSKEMVELHFKHNINMFEELEQLTKEINKCKR